jgi:hypothetical protein
MGKERWRPEAGRRENGRRIRREKKETGDWKKRKGTDMGETIRKFEELVVWKEGMDPN